MAEHFAAQSRPYRAHVVSNKRHPGASLRLPPATKFHAFGVKADPRSHITNQYEPKCFPTRAKVTFEAKPTFLISLHTFDQIFILTFCSPSQVSLSCLIQGFIDRLRFFPNSPRRLTPRQVISTPQSSGCRKHRAGQCAPYLAACPKPPYG